VPAIPRPGRFLVAHPAHFLALGFGSGLAPVMPGTFGTLVAFPLYYLFVPFIGDVGVVALTAPLLLLGTWVCARTGADLGVSDHGGMVWDEIVAFLVVLAVAPGGLWWRVAEFVLFRFFDMVKPPPIRHFDRSLKGGFGVMFDDLLAAFYTLLVLAIAVRFLHPGLNH
jgi:phosphatidylglycerophosphatase A